MVFRKRNHWRDISNRSYSGRRSPQNRPLTIFALIVVVLAGYLSGASIPKESGQGAEEVAGHGTEVEAKEPERASLSPLYVSDSGPELNGELAQRVTNWRELSAAKVSGPSQVTDDHRRTRRFSYEASLDPDFLVQSMEISVSPQNGEGFLDVEFGGDSNGAYVMRFSQEGLLLLYAVQSAQRHLLEDLSEKLGVSGVPNGPLLVSFRDNGGSIDWAGNHIEILPGKDLRSGAVRIASSLRRAELRSFVISSIFHGDTQSDRGLAWMY